MSKMQQQNLHGENGKGGSWDDGPLFGDVKY